MLLYVNFVPFQTTVYLQMDKLYNIIVIVICSGWLRIENNF